MVLQKAPKPTLSSLNKAPDLQDDGARESSKDVSAVAQRPEPDAKPLTENDRSPSSNDGEEEEIMNTGEEFCTPLLLLIKVAFCGAEGTEILDMSRK